MQIRNKKVRMDDETGFLSWCNQLKVPVKGANVHILIEEHAKEMKNRKIRQNEKYIDCLSTVTRWHIEKAVSTNQIPILNIKVAEQTRKRAYLFMDYFIRCMEDLGGKVEVDTASRQDNMKVMWQECQIEGELVEEQIQRRDLLKGFKPTMHPSYEWVPTGKLTFSLTIVKTKDVIKIGDDQESMMEVKLKSLFMQMAPILIAEHQKAVELQLEREVKREEDWRRWEQEEKEREKKRLLEKRYLKEKAYRAQIIEQVDKWSKIKQIENYITDIQKEISGRPEVERPVIQAYCSLVQRIFNKENLYKEILEIMEKDFNVDAMEE
ncbi:MAG: hypothetical protein PHG16_07175 [Lachnospiraceae bacterium]|nr:hypothetical protein [Lachnospiraceae bacterium]